MLQTNEIFHRFSYNQHILDGLLLFFFQFFFIFILFIYLFSTHVVKERYLNSEYCLVTLFKLNNILPLNSIVSGDEERFYCFALELLPLLAQCKVVRNFLISSFVEIFLKVVPIISTERSVINLGELSFDC